MQPSPIGRTERSLLPKVRFFGCVLAVMEIPSFFKARPGENGS